MILLAILGLAGFPLQARTGFTLGLAENFAVLAGSTVTNTGPTVINGGSVGVSPGSAVTGFPPGIVSPPYTIHAADAAAQMAQNDLTTAYNILAGFSPTQNLTGQDLGGLTLVPGVYIFSSSAQLTGTLTLNAQGNPNAQFFFQIGSTLTTASDSSIVTINGGSMPGCNVFWQVGSSATLGTGTAFEGNILALTSITLNTDATIMNGSALARNGAVTLDSNTIDDNCTSAKSVNATPVPPSMTLGLVAAALLMLPIAMKRLRGGSTRGDTALNAQAAA
jgi:type VI secretion system secreted protein VgrG